MNPGFGVIFLCVLMGAIVGFEIGKYVTTKKIQEFLGKLGDDMKKQAELKRKEVEEALDNVVKSLGEIAERRKEAELQKPEPLQAHGDTDGDYDVEAARKKALEIMERQKTQAWQCETPPEHGEIYDYDIEAARKKFHEVMERMKNGLDQLKEDKQ